MIFEERIRQNMLRVNRSRRRWEAFFALLVLACWRLLVERGWVDDYRLGPTSLFRQRHVPEKNCRIPPGVHGPSQQRPPAVQHGVQQAGPRRDLVFSLRAAAVPGGLRKLPRALCRRRNGLPRRSLCVASRCGRRVGRAVKAAPSSVGRVCACDWLQQGVENDCC
ncbi:hypothetical protein DFJ73DRAFT_847220 [Zopfochytrium polystomum]|nr:hypothetical protein DFJ73DRAFT_847220 [Zopfochytrium polystomum]